jgi:hypothetical protein
MLITYDPYNQLPAFPKCKRTSNKYPDLYQKSKYSTQRYYILIQMSTYLLTFFVIIPSMIP